MIRACSPLDSLAEFTQHSPPEGAHLIRYYPPQADYSNKARGMRRKAAEAEAATEQPAGSSSGLDFGPPRQFGRNRRIA